MEKVFHPVAKPPIGKGEEEGTMQGTHQKGLAPPLPLELGPFSKRNEFGC